jgi:DNA-binding HxlR family transcriptional regulator
VDWTELTDLLDTIDGKWDLGILANLEAGPMRPADLCRTINDQVQGTVTSSTQACWPQPSSG